MEVRTAAFAGLRLQLYLKMFNVALHQVGAIILAILLLPRDFALVGLASVFLGFALSISEFGLGSALIQSPDMSESTLATGTTLRLILSGALMVPLLIFSPFIASL